MTRAVVRAFGVEHKADDPLEVTRRANRGLESRFSGKVSLTRADPGTSNALPLLRHHALITEANEGNTIGRNKELELGVALTRKVSPVPCTGA